MTHTWGKSASAGRSDQAQRGPEDRPLELHATQTGRVRALVRAINNGDDAVVEQAVLELSRSRRMLAPLAFLVGAFVMLFQGVKLLVSNWRLSLIQILPAMWIWLAMFDLKAHLLHGKSFHVVRGPVLILVLLAIAGVAAAAFYLNAVFAFAIARPGQPDIKRAFAEARTHLRVVLGWGLAVGVCLGVSTTVCSRWGRWWFAVSLSVVIAVMMVAYVSVPSRLVGLKTTYSKRDQLSATVIGGTIGAIVCTPPYVLGRIGVLMLGSHALFVLGVIVLAIAVTLQAGATGAVKAIKMSAKLVAGHANVVTPAAN
ncbi:MAG: hypothetical protein ACJ735_00340 [Actinomycetes bacterium]